MTSSYFHNKVSFNRFSLLLLMIGLQCLFSAKTLAQTKDSQQPLQITADRLVTNEKTGASEYQGKVQIIQGSFSLNGDKVEISHPDNRLKSIRATGKPADFKQFNIEEQAWVTGKANQIFYNADNKTLRLSGNAEIRQDNKHQIKGENLLYDFEKQTLQASGDNKQRIEVILQPNTPE